MSIAATDSSARAGSGRNRPILAPKLSEDQLHRAVVRHLQVRAKPGLAFFHVPNGGTRNRIEAARFTGLGTKAGIPDLVLIHGGRTHFLELKADSGRVSPAQRAMHAELTAAGALVAVTHGFQAALDQLDAWGLMK